MKRWPIIRHIRYLILRRQLGRWWAGYGRHRFLLVNERDLLYLDRVWRGEA